MQSMKWILLSILCPFMAFSQASDRISLAGEWRFALDSLDQGEQKQWYNDDLKDKILLPGITDEGGYGEEVIENGKLSRLHKYIGKAWYQQDILIPENWKDRHLTLSLERVMWKSELWLDGKYIDNQESLSTPHIYTLGQLKPGKHTLTLCIDNREIYPIGNVWGHSYGDQTQIIWNGVIGQIDLIAHQEVEITQTRTFPDMAGNLDIELSFINRNKKQQKANLLLSIKEKASGREVHSGIYPRTIPVGKSVSTVSLQVDDPLLWDEFNPHLYTLEYSLKNKSGVDTYAPVHFGFRTLNKTEDFITINGIPRYLRGNLECALFPLTGYPPTDKESWLRIFRLYKDYGLNHARFHSWTPPEAAFEAADEMGIYVLSEIFWRDGWMGKGLDIDSVAPFMYPELKRIADQYGNHPSLIALAMGNELGGFDRNRMDPWIAEVKEHDPRHFYSVSVRRPATEHTDINFQGDLSSPYPLLFINEGRMSTDWDYAEWYGKASPLPSIQHEVGQWVFYPDWKETEKYTGNLRARGLEKYKELAKQKGVYTQNKEFVQASGLQSINLYKENIESLLRTPLCGGFQLLSMQDFSGQGEALIGWLDAFYDDKGVVTPERFRQWCNTTVPLMRAPSYIYTNRDTLRVGIDILHFADRDIPDAAIEWQLTGETGNPIQSGVFDSYTIRNATLNKVGYIQVPLQGISCSSKVKLMVSVRDTDFKNDWNFWIFPADETLFSNENIIETNSPEEAIEGLKRGEKVFLWAYGLGSNINTGYAGWKPTFWQAKDIGHEGFTNGALIRNDHAAFHSFPTDNYLDFQWHDICKGGRGFDLAGLPASVLPIVQPIHDFHFNRKLGAIMEFNSQEGGKLLVCGYNLVDSLEKRPAAIALRNSLMKYVASNEFQPAIPVDYEWIKSRLQDMNKPYLPPSGFENAYLYVKAGGRWQKNGQTEWNTEKDAATFYETDKYGYNVNCDHIIVHESFSAWEGKNIQVDIKMPFHFDGSINLLFANPDEKNRECKIFFNGEEIIIDQIPDAGKWISLPMNAGEALLGKISVTIETLSTETILIDGVALLPR